MTDASWFILSVKSSDDFKVESQLIEAGIFAIAFITEKVTAHKRTKKIITRISPLFPSYVFVQCGPDDWAGIKRMDGAIRFLSAASPSDDAAPLAIDPYAVYSLLAKERAGAFRVGKGGLTVDLGDVVMCEVLGQMVQATVIKSGDKGATLETTINGMRVVLNKTPDELRAA